MARSLLSRLSRTLRPATPLLTGLGMLGFPAIVLGQRLEIVPPQDSAVISRYRARESFEVRKVRITGADTLAIDKAWCRYQQGDDVPPDGTPDVMIVGLRNVTLAKDQEVEMTLLFPAYPKAASYSAALYFKRKGGAEEGEKFYTFKIAVLEPSGTLPKSWARWVGLLSFAFPVMILILTIAVRGREKRNFFQSPDPTGTYSVSRFQVWLWTNVVIFSYAYLYFTQGPNIPFPDSIWGLLGISLGSIGAATALAVQKDQAREQAAPPSAAPKRASALKSMLSEDGNPSIMRLQMFAWTVATAVFFVRQVYATGMLWDVPSSLLVLMGISHGSYLVDKGLQKK